MEPALQADSFFFRRPLLLTNLEKLGDPDHWEPMEPNTITAAEKTVVSTAVMKMANEGGWIVDRTPEKSCPRVDEKTATVIIENLKGNGTRDSGDENDAFYFFKQRPLDFVSKKKGIALIQARILFHSALSE